MNVSPTFRSSDTLDAKRDERAAPKVAGLVLVFAAGQPLSLPLPFERGELELGRATSALEAAGDLRMSRRHARVSFDGSTVRVCDLGSQNGTWADGIPVPTHKVVAVNRVLRLADSIFLLCDDLRGFQELGVRRYEGRIIGPRLHSVLQAVMSAARLGPSLHITGESGVGKEGAARAFHAATPRGPGPFVAVNCAAVPVSLAESLLFGARRGAFSGAVQDSEGYLQAASGGTLFLDEIAELDLAVQAKLLRVLETREVLPLGSTRPQAVDVRICSASLKDLRAEVAKRRMREDLYFRVGRPSVLVPPLRERLEEIPWLVELELQQSGVALRPHATLIEACILRQWPGNLRELCAEIRTAAHEALSQRSPIFNASHLASTAGTAFSSPASPLDLAAPLSPPPSERATLEGALRQTAGNVSGAARVLGLQRNQLRRLLISHNITAKQYFKRF